MFHSLQRSLLRVLIRSYMEIGSNWMQFTLLISNHCTHVFFLPGMSVDEHNVYLTPIYKVKWVVVMLIH